MCGLNAGADSGDVVVVEEVGSHAIRSCYATTGNASTDLGFGMAISNRILEIITPELSPGETIEWMGMPNASVVFHEEDALLIPFTLLVGAFAIFWRKSRERTARPRLLSRCWWAHLRFSGLWVC